MKKLNILLITFISLFIFSCDDDFDTPPAPKPLGGTAPVINALASPVDAVLQKINADKTITTISWKAATYAENFSTKYFVQIDSKGGDFSKAAEFKETTETSFAIKVGELNKLLLDKNFKAATKVSIDIRVKAFVNKDIEDLFTKTISIDVTPYLDVPVPSALFFTGDASTVGFATDKSLEFFKNGQVFTKYLKLIKDKQFRFIDKKADDAYKYNFGKFATIPATVVDGQGDDNNFKFTGETGWYKVVADFAMSSLTIEKKVEGSTTYSANPDNLYLVGAYNTTDAEWNPASAPAFTKTSEGIFTIDRVLKDGAQLKFIGQQSWGDLDWANIAGKGNSGILAPKGDNDNITFDGANKLHTITVNLNTGTFSIVKKELPDLFLVGAATANGWNEGNRVAMYRDGSSRVVYTYLKQKASNDDQFRFIDVNNGWNGNFGFPFFSSVPSTITAVPASGDGNMFFTGATGIYKITVSIDKELSIEATTLGYDYPEMYIVGSINGWNEKAAPAMTKESEGVFSYTTQLSNDAQFKFIGQQAWAEKEWADISGEGNSGFIAPKGSNNNIKFSGDGTSNYKITFFLKEGKYTIVKQ